MMYGDVHILLGLALTAVVPKSKAEGTLHLRSTRKDPRKRALSLLLFVKPRDGLFESVLCFLILQKLCFFYNDLFNHFKF